MDRREFISNSVRWILAGGLVGTTGLLWYRRRIGDPSDCFVNPYCKRCKQSAACSIYADLTTDKNESQTKK